MSTKHRFEDFMSTGMAKSASAPTPVRTDLLMKISSMIGAPNLADNQDLAAASAASGEATGVPGTPVIGQVVNAGSATVAAPAAGTVAAIDGLVNPQVQASGGDVAAMAVGSTPGVGTVEPVRVSDATGDVEENMAIVNSVTNGAPVSAEKTASLLNAIERGRFMARGYADEITKIAATQRLEQSVELLKSAGIFAHYGYQIEAGFDKQASAPQVSAFDKMASGAVLTADDICNAADEFLLFKQAEANVDAEAESLTDSIIKQAADEVAEELMEGSDDVAEAAAQAAYEAAVASAGSDINASTVEAAATAAANAVSEKSASAPTMDFGTAVGILRAAGKL